MRYSNFSENEYYHLCSRGVSGSDIFLDGADYARFLFMILHFQSPIPTHNIRESTSHFSKRGFFKIDPVKLESLLNDRELELISFALMPNHFHLLVKNLKLQATSIYMHRVLMGYSKYFNAKYKRSGHLFQGPFKAVHTETNEQLLLTSAYIHKNPKEIHEINELKTDYSEYPWSSFQDYIDKNRWGDLLKRDIILDQFKSKDAYTKFVHTSKTKGEELDLPII